MSDFNVWQWLTSINRPEVHPDRTEPEPKFGREKESEYGSDITRLSETVKAFYDSMALGSSERSKIYEEYEKMDEDSIEISTGLNIYADDATQINHAIGKRCWITSKNEKVRDMLERMLRRIDVEQSLWGIARDTAKYGGVPFMVPSVPVTGILGLKDVSMVDLIREENSRGQLHKWTYFRKPYFPWEFVYFRIIGTVGRRSLSGRRNSQYEDQRKYGKSMIESARYHYRRLAIAEDAMLLARIVRAPGRIMWEVDIGSKSLLEALKQLRQWRRMFRRHSYFDPTSGKLEVTKNPLAVQEDIIIPKAKDSSTTATEMASLGDVSAIADVDYFRSKLHVALVIPPEVMGFTEGPGDLFGQNLARKDIRFARTIARLQSSVIGGIVELGMIELALKGLDPSDPDNEFTVHLMPASDLEELSRFESLTTVVEFARSLLDLIIATEVDEEVKKGWHEEVITFVMNFITPRGMSTHEGDVAESLDKLKSKLGNSVASRAISEAISRITSSVEDIRSASSISSRSINSNVFKECYLHHRPTKEESTTA